MAMTDNIVSVNFQKKASTEELLETLSDMSFDTIVFVGTKDEEIFVGTSAIENVSTAIGDLILAQQYLIGEALG